MGYDMYLKEKVPGEAEAIAAAEQARERASSALQQLRDAGEDGSWFSPEEEQLPDEERASVGHAHVEKMNKLIDGGMDLARARHAVYSVPPTERYLKAFDALQAAQRAVYDAEKSYYRLNIWGMGVCRDQMEELGMVKEPLDDLEWPDWTRSNETREALEGASYYSTSDAKTTTEQLAEAHENEGWRESYGEVEITDDDLAAFEAYQIEQNAKLAAHDESTPGISYNKLCSNDGWHVTADECSGALKVWNGHPQDVRNAVLDKHLWWKSWLEFLENGAAGDGFEVH